MEGQTITTSPTPEVVITDIAGNLLVKGWEHSKILIDAEADNLTVEEQEDGVRIKCDSDCNIHLPLGSTVTVAAVHGNAHFKNLDDALTIELVHGSLTLRSVATVKTKEINGDLSSKGIAGDLEVEQVHGNASARGVQGNCSLGEVQGNLDLRKIDGDIQAKAAGNARLRLNAISAEKYRVAADGNLYCHIPDDADLHLILTSEGEIMKIKLPGEANTIRKESFELTLGEGTAEMSLHAGGALYLFGRKVSESDREDEFGAAFEEMFEQQIEAQLEGIMASVSHTLEEQMGRLEAHISRAGLSAEQTERIIEQARGASERRAERAQEKMRRAQEKIERKLEAARRHEQAKAKAAEHRTHARRKRAWNFEWTTPPSVGIPISPDAGAEPAGEEERLMILRMLEQKKISLEEAERLLSALDG